MSQWFFPKYCDQKKEIKNNPSFPLQHIDIYTGFLSAQRVLRKSHVLVMSNR